MEGGRGCPPPPRDNLSGFFFVFAIKICLRPVASQLRHSSVVHPLLNKNPGSAPDSLLLGQPKSLLSYTFKLCGLFYSYAKALIIKELLLS